MAAPTTVPTGLAMRVLTAAPVTAPPVAPTPVPTGWTPDSPVIGSLLRWLLPLMAVFLICNVDRSGKVSIVWLLRRSIQCFVNDYCADHVSFASRVCLLCRKEAIPVVIDSSKTCHPDAVKSCTEPCSQNADLLRFADDIDQKNGQQWWPI